MGSFERQDLPGSTKNNLFDPLPPGDAFCISIVLHFFLGA